MPEIKKVRFLMRGVKQELFAGLMRNQLSTVQEFISEATTIEKTLEMRTRKFNRHTSSEYAEVQPIYSDNLGDTIRAIVWEELRKLLLSAQPQVDSIAEIV
ncbi:uncharacterized protein LOC142776682 isoform X1 [Rhipicephalus microplus]|uniref:uncharacterized protein LOC142776682 isoform X1 n=1 Tax=Rhipicephalus microplus TaxID=6941 RepID=UPI003F6A5AF6